MRAKVYRPSRRLRAARVLRAAASWLAALALTIHALWPLTALAAPSGIALPNGICSASGFRLGKPTEELPTPASSSHERMQCLQCGLCASPLGHGVLLTTPFQVPAAALTIDARQRPVPRSVSDSSRWIPGARPRAPPTAPFSC